MNSGLSKNHKDQESDLSQVYNAENELKLELASPDNPADFHWRRYSRDSLSEGFRLHEMCLLFHRAVEDTQRGNANVPTGGGHRPLHSLRNVHILHLHKFTPGPPSGLLTTVCTLFSYAPSWAVGSNDSRAALRKGECVL